MQIGCGVYAHEVSGRRYLYFWHYETVGGRRRQVKEYLGPAEDEDVREEAIRRCDAYVGRVARELGRARKKALLDIAQLR